MKDLGTTIKCLGKARFILPVVQCIKAIGFATSLMVKGCTHGLTAAGMKASGGATACMEKVYTKTFMERVGMESFITAQVLV
mmetsp:Transcript_72990/g.122955  ORF Transcript_72990/g.122955 Transcript_72990/m.122955 type:complete len:82 (+) Transcript_72990:233-478(+)